MSFDETDIDPSSERRRISHWIRFDPLWMMQLSSMSKRVRTCRSRTRYRPTGCRAYASL